MTNGFGYNGVSKFTKPFFSDNLLPGLSFSMGNYDEPIEEHIHTSNEGLKYHLAKMDVKAKNIPCYKSIHTTINAYENLFLALFKVSQDDDKVVNLRDFSKVYHILKAKEEAENPDLATKAEDEGTIFYE